MAALKFGSRGSRDSGTVLGFVGSCWPANELFCPLLVAELPGSPFPCPFVLEMLVSNRSLVGRFAAGFTRPTAGPSGLPV